MTKVNVLLTSDKVTMIVLLGEPVEGTPSLGLDLNEGAKLEDGIADIERLLKSDEAPIHFLMGGGPYAPESAAQYSPEKVAEFEIDNPALDRFIEAVA